MLFIPSTHTLSASSVPQEDPRIEAIADVILQLEGRCSGPGQSGETGCFQFQDRTWRAYSNIVAGEVLEQTPENERRVAEKMIETWLDEGVSERGVFLTWNQGDPNGWGPGDKDCYEGVNQWGVPYDSCEYAARGLRLLEERLR